VTAKSSWAGCLWGSCGIAIVLWAGAAAGLPDVAGFRPAVSAVHVTAGTASSLAPLSHRLVTRAQHTVDRLLLLVGAVGIFWLWAALSIAAFLMVAAFASVVDTRMFTLRHEPAGAVARYLGYGIRTFFLILLDRRTPYVARVFLALALVYWLVPFDLIADKSVVPGFIDDLAVAVVAAKGFVYLCPTSLVAAHAHAVEERARRRLLPKPPDVAAPAQDARPHQP
jgi:uncharacterized membrane protein YkvA (DUF1232 family)